MPVLERSGDHVRLLVDGKPFLCLGGELHNSSSSDAIHMSLIWDCPGRSGVSSVVASVGWDQVEPDEGRFDFGVVDDLLHGARSAGVRLVLIWFGAFKNAFVHVRADLGSRGPARVPSRRPRRGAVFGAFHLRRVHAATCPVGVLGGARLGGPERVHRPDAPSPHGGFRSTRSW